MKKVFGIVAALAITASLMAANTANFVIAVESPDNDNIYDELVMAESTDYTAAYENLRDAEKMADANNPSLYGYVENRKCGVIATNNLDGTLLTLETVGETDYDISFYGVAGTTYYLIDLVSGASVQIAEGNTLEVRGVAANSTLADRFKISTSAVATVTTVTTNAYGYASFSYTEDLKLASAGAKLYTGTVSGETLNMTEVDYVKAGQGVIVKGAANTTYNLVAGTGSSVYGANALIASANWTAATEDAYFLVGNEFKKYTGTEAVPAGKAYLIYTASGANPAPRRIVMRFNTTTAVENVEAVEKGVKFMENGQIFIRRGENVYNAQGQMVK